MKQKLKKAGYWASVITLGLVVGISLQMVRANWTAPATTAPNGNIGAPINTGNNGQIKGGSFTASTLISPRICIGTDCRTAWPSGGGSAVPSGLYGSCVVISRGSGTNLCSGGGQGLGCSGAVAPASCASGSCRCASGYTLMRTGQSIVESWTCGDTTTNYYTCRAN